VEGRKGVKGFGKPRAASISFALRFRVHHMHIFTKSILSPSHLLLSWYLLSSGVTSQTSTHRIADLIWTLGVLLQRSMFDVSNLSPVLSIAVTVIICSIFRLFRTVSHRSTRNIQTPRITQTNLDAMLRGFNCIPRCQAVPTGPGSVY